MTIREICEYYGQQYDNVKHMTNFLKTLKERYKKELNKINHGNRNNENQSSIKTTERAKSIF